MVNQVMAGVLVVTAGAGAIFSQAGTGAVSRSAPEMYRVRTLESLGGSNNRANSLNDLGIVSGYSDLPTGQRRASAWWLGQRMTIEPLGGTHNTVAWPVKNNIGLIVGVTQTAELQRPGAQWSCRIFFPAADNTRFQCVGFVWERGRVRPLPTLGGDNGFATGANNWRQVVGWAENRVEDESCQENVQDLQFRAVRWDLNRDRTHELRPFGDDSSSAATAINDRGQVVGISGDCDQAVGRFTARHAVIWEQDQPRRLDDLGGGAWNTPTAINQRGDMIAGFAMPPGEDPFNARLRAVLWTKRDDVCSKVAGKDICDLGTLDGHVSSQANGINDRGQIVGTSCPAAGLCRGFVWENGVMHDLNDLVADGLTDQFETAQDVNNLGQIAGRSAHPTTFRREAIVATPVRR